MASSSTKTDEKSTLSAQTTSPSPSHDEIPPTYIDAAASSSSQSSGARPPPSYESVQRALSAALAQGDPDETISVPMVTRTKAKSLHDLNPFSHKQGAIRQHVVTRQMKRSTYLAHYAKDADGRFVGTGAPAPDAALVFVPGKSSDAEMLRQAEEVAVKVQRLRGAGLGDWGKPLADNMMGYVPASGGM